MRITRLKYRIDEQKNLHSLNQMMIKINEVELKLMHYTSTRIPMQYVITHHGNMYTNNSLLLLL